MPHDHATRFRAEYAAHRASEGRRHDRAELLALPYLTSGPLARQWSVRARSFDAFVRHVLAPLAAARRQPLDLLDLGAGNGWLSYRAARDGHHAVAVDLRDDTVDGLGAAAAYTELVPGLLSRISASFDALPLRDGRFDVVIFNAALHYALDLATVVQEARRVVRPGGKIVVLDSPFYASDDAGLAMVEEKHRDATRRFGDRADALLALPFVEFLTPERLNDASRGLHWRKHRVRYPLWYEMRPVMAWLRGRRMPSRFDLWECTAP